MNKFIVLPSIAFILFIAACSSGEQPDSKAEAKQDENVSEEGDVTYNLENDGIDEEAFQDELNEFPELEAERVITTSVPITEMLYLLGVTPVGVPTSNNPIPEAFQSIDQIGSPMQPDLEVVTNLESDLLIGAKSLESSLEESLSGIDLDRTYLKTDSYDDLKRSFKVLGTYFDKTEEMNDVLSDILTMENDLLKRAEGKELPSVLLIIGTSDSFMVMGENSYVGSLIDKLGAENIATTVLNTTETYSPINMEDLVVADPDLIFVLASGDHGASEDMFAKEVEKNAVWKSLSAYQQDNIHMLKHDVFGVTSIVHVEEAMTGIADYFFTE